MVVISRVGELLGPFQSEGETRCVQDCVHARRQP